MSTESEPTTSDTPQVVTQRARRRILIRHYLEMVVAMLVAMGVIGLARMVTGLSISAGDDPTLAYLIMALDMSIGMAAVMRWRRHRWSHVAEMCGAMFAPALLFPALGAVLSIDALMVLAHVVMFVAMATIMVMRRDVYAAHHVLRRDSTDGPTAARPGLRKVKRIGKSAAKITAAVLVALALPVAVAVPSMTAARSYFYTEPPGQMPRAPSHGIARHDPAKPTAVVVLGNEGTNAADSLPPFEVLSASGAFNVYTVAEERRLVPLVGGLDLVPDLSYDGLDRLLDDTPPDVIVVPQIEGEPRSGSPVIGWLDEQRRAGSPLIASVCVGAEILAEAGYLDGRPATSHWLGMIGLRRSHPDVEWVDDVRYVDDGDVITSAGVLSGIDGTLRAVERLAGQAAATRAAAALHWPYYNPGKAAAIDPPHLEAEDSVGLLSAAYRWDREDLGVLLTDGVTETELASIFRGYTEFNFLAEPLAFTTDGRPIRSRHGLTFVPRADATEAAARVDRILVPGTEAAQRREAVLPETASDLPVSYPHAGPGFAFNGTLADVADHHDSATARWVAKTLQYPTAGLDLSGPAWPWSLTLRFALLTAAGLALAIGATRLLRRLRPKAMSRDEG